MRELGPIHASAPRFPLATSALLPLRGEAERPRPRRLHAALVRTEHERVPRDSRGAAHPRARERAGVRAVIRASGLRRLALLGAALASGGCGALRFDPVIADDHAVTAVTDDAGPGTKTQIFKHGSEFLQMRDKTWSKSF